jgi:hypothetical protein
MYCQTKLASLNIKFKNFIFYSAGILQWTGMHDRSQCKTLRREPVKGILLTKTNRRPVIAIKSFFNYSKRPVRHF